MALGRHFGTVEACQSKVKRVARRIVARLISHRQRSAYMRGRYREMVQAVYVGFANGLPFLCDDGPFEEEGGREDLVFAGRPPSKPGLALPLFFFPPLASSFRLARLAVRSCCRAAWASSTFLYRSAL